MTQEEWNTYIETGFVPQHFIKDMVDRIKSGKPLDVKHLQVYVSHGKIIELYLKK